PMTRSRGRSKGGTAGLPIRSSSISPPTPRSGCNANCWPTSGRYRTPSRASHPAGELTRCDAADAFDDGVPVVDFAILWMDHDVLHPGRRVGGDALAHQADVLAVPVRTHRDRKARLGPGAAQPL